MTRYVKPRKVVNIRTDMEPYFKKKEEHVADDEKGPMSFFGRKPPTTSLAYEDLFEGETGEDVKREKPTAEKDKPRGEDGKSNQSRTTPMDGKTYSNLDVTTVDVSKQVVSKINQIKDMISKAPPIFNPTRAREDAEGKNDNLEGRALEELFEKVIDPKIVEASNEDETYVTIDPKELGMSLETAEKKIEGLYTKKLGYPSVFISQGKVNIRLER
tara:strand:+ start:693 stop:1337 length:645 start_codon:yes stop_codon:yes gene_type:complete